MGGGVSWDGMMGGKDIEESIKRRTYLKFVLARFGRGRRVQ